MNLLRPPLRSESSLETRLKGLPLKLRVDPRTFVGRHIFYFGSYETGVLATFKRAIEPGMTIVDVGANYGLYSIIAGFMLRGEGQVLSFEPQHRIFSDFLLYNVACNNLSSVIECYQLALASKMGYAKLYQASRSNDGQATLQLRGDEGHFGEAEDVATNTLDDMLAEQAIEKVDIVKIDVEGAEYEVLLGMEQLLKRNPPSLIFLECIDAHLRRFDRSSKELFSFLHTHGYRLFARRRGRWRAFSDDAEFIAMQSPPDVLARCQG